MGAFTPGFGPPGGTLPGYSSTMPYQGPFSQATISTPLAPPPQQLTNYSTLINGGYKEAGVFITRNGLLQTEGYDYTRDKGLVTFLLVPPVAGDLLTAQVYAIGLQLGGNNPQRYIAPWTLPLTGAFDGVGLVYSISFGPTIQGGCDGRNKLFTFQVTFQRISVWRNGLLLTAQVDYSAAPTAIVFLPGAIPQAGDLLTILGYSS